MINKSDSENLSFYYYYDTVSHDNVSRDPGYKMMLLHGLMTTSLNLKEVTPGQYSQYEEWKVLTTH